MEQFETIARERIDRIEKGVLLGRRPRQLGRNARISVHGDVIRDQVVRIRTAGGGMGIGWSGIAEEQAAELVGRRIGELFSMPDGASQAGVPIDPAALGPVRPPGGLAPLPAARSHAARAR